MIIIIKMLKMLKMKIYNNVIIIDFPILLNMKNLLYLFLVGLINLGLIYVIIKIIQIQHFFELL